MEPSVLAVGLQIWDKHRACPSLLAGGPCWLHAFGFLLIPCGRWGPRTFLSSPPDRQGFPSWYCFSTVVLRGIKPGAGTTRSVVPPKKKYYPLVPYDPSSRFHATRSGGRPFGASSTRLSGIPLLSVQLVCHQPAPRGSDLGAEDVTLWIREHRRESIRGIDPVDCTNVVPTQFGVGPPGDFLPCLLPRPPVLFLGYIKLSSYLPFLRRVLRH